MALTRAEILALDIQVKGAAAAVAKLKATGDAAEKANKKTGRSSKAAAASVVTLNKALFLGAASLVVGGITAINKFAAAAEKITNVSRSFQILTARIGQTSSAMLGGMRQASKGFIGDIELMRQANNAMILGLPVTTESMEDMTEVAINLGRALGVDATRALESLITGIGRQSRLMLDNIGIIVSKTIAEERHAMALGVTVYELTATERKLAFYNETLRQGGLVSSILAAETSTLSDKIKGFRTEIENVINRYIELVNEAGDKTTTLGEIWDRLGRGPVLALMSMHTKPSREREKGEGIVGDIIDERQLELLGIYQNELRALVDLEERHAPIRERNAAALKAINTQIERMIPGLDYLRTLSADAETEDGAGGGLLGGVFGGDREDIPATHDDMLDSMIGSITTFEETWSEQAERGAEKRTRIARREALHKINLQTGVNKALLNLGSALFGNHKVFAIAQSIMDTHVAVMKTMASIPYPANLAAAAQVKVMGWLNTAAIAATALGGGGGGGGGGGVGGGGGFAAAGGIGGGVQAGPTEPAQGPLELRIFIEGQGFVQNIDEFAQEIGEAYAREAGRAGTLTGGFT